jgi:hypothetical protein
MDTAWRLRAGKPAEHVWDRITAPRVARRHGSYPRRQFALGQGEPLEFSSLLAWQEDFADSNSLLALISSANNQYVAELQAAYEAGNPEAIEIYSGIAASLALAGEGEDASARRYDPERAELTLWFLCPPEFWMPPPDDTRFYQRASARAELAGCALALAYEIFRADYGERITRIAIYGIGEFTSPITGNIEQVGVVSADVSRGHVEGIRAENVMPIEWFRHVGGRFADWESRKYLEFPPYPERVGFIVPAPFPDSEELFRGSPTEEPS